jgi:hypothetical protein
MNMALGANCKAAASQPVRPGWQIELCSPLLPPSVSTQVRIQVGFERIMIGKHPPPATGARAQFGALLMTDGGTQRNGRRICSAG